jgi:hypothetical protein
MKVTRERLQIDSKWWSVEHDVPRSAGVHLSNIIDVIERQIDPQQQRKDSDVWARENYMFGGFIYEHAAARSIIEHECSRSDGTLIRPGEYFYCVDCQLVIWPTTDIDGNNLALDHCAARGHKGIFATPDGLNIPRWRTKEWKFTWKSSNRAGGDDDGSGIEHIRIGLWRWPVQVKGYCFLMETVGADLDAFFVNGDYRNRIPQCYRFAFDFTPVELSTQWNGFVDTARKEGLL